MSFNRTRERNILGGIVFLIAFLSFVFTTLPSVGFWDSGEFISSSYKLEVSHPPGAPLYTLITHFVTLFVPVEHVALACNVFSGLCAAITVWILFRVITMIGIRVASNLHAHSRESEIAILGGALVGSLSLAYAHSFWIEATESEVYSLGALFMGGAYWLTLKWEQLGSDHKDFKLIILLTYILGLSVGVHIMNMAIIFPIAMVFGLSKYPLSWKTFVLSVAAGLGLFILMYIILIQGFLKVATWMELMLVNQFDMPFHSGVFLFLTALISSISLGLWWSQKHHKLWLNQALLMVSFFTIGWSSYTLVIVRSQFDAPVSNHASDVLRLLGYLQADQYSTFTDRSMISGKFYDSPLDEKRPFIDGLPQYVKNDSIGKYIVSNSGKDAKANYASKFNLFFPRMYNSQLLDKQGYKDWGDVEGRAIDYRVKGEVTRIVKPTFIENFWFYLNYQVGWLDLRYLMWNYTGRQNGDLGKGDPLRGNWLSGFSWIDDWRVGAEIVTPKSTLNDKSRNVFYGLPFLLGIIGFIVLCKHHKKYALSTLVFFLFMSLGTTTYINQVPSDVFARERDYIFLGAYFAFSLWVGLSVPGLFFMIKSVKSTMKKALVITAIAFIIAPLSMGLQGWNDHDKSEDSFPRDFGKAYLDSCEPNALLIVTGDNIMYPVWYLQEVEGYRTDVRVINYDLLDLDWYVDRLKKEMNASPPIRLSLPKEMYQRGSDQFMNFIDKNQAGQYVKLDRLVAFVANPNNHLKIGDRTLKYFPTDLFKIEVDTTDIKNSGLNPNQYQGMLTHQVNWKFTKTLYGKIDLILLDILSQNNWERPIHFANTGNYEHRIGLGKYMAEHGLTSQLLPLVPAKGRARKKLVDIEFNYTFLMETVNFDALGDLDSYVSFENKDIARFVIRPSYYFLAEALIEIGDIERAKKVLQRCLSLMPNETVPFKEHMYDVAKSHFRTDQREVGREIIEKLMANFADEIKLFTSFSPIEYNVTFRKTNSLLEVYKIITNELKVKQPDLHQKYKRNLEVMYKDFERWIRQNNGIPKW